MNKRFKVIDNNLFTVFVGSRFECIAWVERKTNHAESLRCLMDSIDKRIYGRVMELVLR